ncbi:hypothetical protein [uncultured Thiodictyon sp.]|uniref:hypothetical protein n=1 Tax=uncultured Thiodictyon sp. TaxID=1846217 RepID=UPI0025FB0063|nr:hypothetical protein [uncultured Thiodictyon sp.]
MKTPTQLCTEAWLLVGLTGSVPGKLKLAAGRLSFIAMGSGTLWTKELRKLEQAVARPGIAEQLDRGENALVFDLPLSDLTVNFPWYYFSGGMKITAGKNKYRFSFGQPANTTLPVNSANIANVALRVGDQLMEIGTMRGRGAAWKAALLGTS